MPALVLAFPTYLEAEPFLATCTKHFAAYWVSMPKQPLQAGEVHEFVLPSKRIVVLITGIGLLNSSMHLASYLAKQNGQEVEAVVMCGVAGGFDITKTPIGTPVVVTQECFAEYGFAFGNKVEPYTGEARTKTMFAQASIAGEPVWDTIAVPSRITLENMGCVISRIPHIPQAHYGTAVSVAGVTASDTQKNMLMERYAALVENMEGFAAALCTQKFAIPFAEIRVVSNSMGQRASQIWDIPLALQVLADTAVFVCDSYYNNKKFI